MTGILRHFLSAIFTIDFKVLSLRDDLKTCKTKCYDENGHLPYLYQGLDSPIGSNSTEFCINWHCPVIYVTYLMISTMLKVMEWSKIKLLIFIVNFTIEMHLMQCDSRYSKSHNPVARPKASSREILIFSYSLNSISRPKSGNPIISTLTKAIGQNMTILTNIYFLF